ncbi:hypothetical protein L1887_32273 [Cichorium endivia]|nr:hypothetical protein L1887_32273 [Cichorium endivia]
MAPLTIEEDEDDSLDDSDFILGKQYKILNRKLDALLQSSTGFDPTRGTEVSFEDQMAEAQKALTDKMEKMVKDSEKRIFDQQIEIKRVMEGKFNTAVEQIDKRHRLLKEQTAKTIKELVEKMQTSNSEVVKSLSTLNENTSSFNSQYQTSFAKHLSEANKRIEELTAEQSHSTIPIFANELRKTNAAIASDIIEKLRRTLQPMINVSLKMERSQAGRPHPQAIAQAEPMAQPSQGGESATSGSVASKSQALVTQALLTQALVTAALKTQAQGTATTTPKTTSQTTILGRPPFIPTISTAGPAFGTTTTIEAGGSGSRPQGNVLRIAPHMEQVHKEREEDYRKMLMINNIAYDNQTWTAELITAIGFNDFTVFNRLPLRSLETKSRISRQLDLPYNLKTFAFLQFERHVPKEKLIDFKKRKVAFRTLSIPTPNRFRLQTSQFIQSPSNS